MLCHYLNDIAEVFAQLFPVILTDRGSEFSNPWALECDEYGEEISKIFYCNANAPYQKGRLEKNHEFLRYIMSKGTSFDSMTQEMITLSINHINCFYRYLLNYFKIKNMALLIACYYSWLASSEAMLLFVRVLKISIYHKAVLIQESVQSFHCRQRIERA